MLLRENLALRPVPVPDLGLYRRELCELHNLRLPLASIKFAPKGLLNELPPPLAAGRSGWPWDRASISNDWAVDEVPKLSVVIPSFRQGEFIEETIRSVILQNYPALELIVIDGGSDDNTLSVLDHYRDHLSVFLSEPDRGQSHAINKGFSLASGDLYFWLNSDDLLTADCFNRLIPFFIKDPSLEIVYGHGKVIDEDGRITFDAAPLVLDPFLRFGGIVFSHSVMWRSSVHVPVWEDLECAMDAELWLRLFPGRRRKHAGFPIGVFRKHALQKTSSEVMTNKWQQDFEQHIWRYYPSIGLLNWRLRSFFYRIVQWAFRKFHPYDQQ